MTRVKRSGDEENRGKGDVFCSAFWEKLREPQDRTPQVVSVSSRECGVVVGKCKAMKGDWWRAKIY